MTDETGDEPPSGVPEPPKQSNVEAGYRRPPQQTRFKPGQSGNPSGRPRGTRNAKTTLANIVNEPFKVREGERVRRTNRFGAMTLAHVHKGMKGDVRSFNAVTSIMARTGLLDDTDLEMSSKIQLTEDEAIIRDYLTRNKPTSNGDAINDETDRS